MTIGIKMHQTLAGLEVAAANLKTFALDTQDPAAKQMFITFNQHLEGMCQALRSRVNYIEQQEPQYRMMQPGMMQQQPQYRMMQPQQQQYGGFGIMGGGPGFGPGRGMGFGGGMMGPGFGPGFGPGWQAKPNIQ